MGYIKTDWKNLPNQTTPISKDNLNKIEQGIYDATYENGLNVSNEVDEDYRVNLINTNNMVNLEAITEGYYLDSTGTPQSSSSWFYTDYIKVEEGQEIHITGNMAATAGSGVYMCFYNSSKAFVSSIPYANYKEDNTIINIPSGVSYLRMSTRIENESTIKIWLYSSIQVDGNKFTDTLNVGSVVDSRSRVNVLYSKNLFDMNNVNSFLGYFTSQVSVITGTGSGVKILYIPCKPNTTYTVKKVASKRFSVATTRVEPAVGVAFYGGVFGTTTTTQLTITTESEAKYLIVEYYIDGSASPDTLSETQILSSIIINEGSVVVDTPSIYVDNEEIYSKPVVLWENPNPSSAFAGQEITLNDNIENYSYYEIIYILWSNEKQASSTGKVPIEYPSFHEYIASSSSILVGHRRTTNKPANNKITFSNNDKISTTGTTADNSVNIPAQIIGYK